MSRHTAFHRPGHRLSAALFAISLGACAASGGQGGASTSGQGGGSTSASSGGGGEGGGGLLLTVGAGSGGAPACAAQPYQAERRPLDMFLMLDQSKSMSEPTAGGASKWEAVTSALQGFVLQPGTSGIAVGLQFFGLPPQAGSQCSGVSHCDTSADCGPAHCGPCQNHHCGGDLDEQDSCDAADYAHPAVEIAELPGVGSAIVASLAAHMPSTSTPTSAALQGALDHSAAWAAQHTDHVVIAVLATDGQPTECVTDLGDISAIAGAALGDSPSVATFAIGVFAPDDLPSGPDALDQIAAAGGTGQAFVIDTSDPTQDVQTAFLAALDTIRGAALGCQYTIPLPEAGTPDYQNLNVQYSPGGGGATEPLLNYPDAAHCPAGGDGWYYDDNAAPTKILLCGSTCDRIGVDATGTVDVLVGCQTVTGQVY